MEGLMVRLIYFHSARCAAILMSFLFLFLLTCGLIGCASKTPMTMGDHNKLFEEIILNEQSME